MLMDSKEVGDKLGCSNIVARRLGQLGVLTDLKPRTEGASKHYPAFESRQVNKIAKSFKALYKGRINPNLVEELKKVMTESSNGHAVIETTVHVAPPKPRPAPRAAEGFTTRLDRIEAKLDALLKIWS